MLPPKAVSHRSGMALKKSLGTGVRLASHADVLRGSSRVPAPLTSGSSHRTSDIQTLTCLIYLLVAFILSIFFFMVFINLACSMRCGCPVAN